MYELKTRGQITTYLSRNVENLLEKACLPEKVFGGFPTNWRTSRCLAGNHIHIPAFIAEAMLRARADWVKLMWSWLCIQNQMRFELNSHYSEYFESWDFGNNRTHIYRKSKGINYNILSYSSHHQISATLLPVPNSSLSFHAHSTMKSSGCCFSTQNLFPCRCITANIAFTSGNLTAFQSVPAS